MLVYWKFYSDCLLTCCTCGFHELVLLKSQTLLDCIKPLVGNGEAMLPWGLDITIDLGLMVSLTGVILPSIDVCLRLVISWARIASWYFRYRSWTKNKLSDSPVITLWIHKCTYFTCRVVILSIPAIDWNSLPFASVMKFGMFLVSSNWDLGVEGIDGSGRTGEVETLLKVPFLLLEVKNPPALFDDRGDLACGL